MSYVFSGNDDFTGDLGVGATLNYPITVACWTKYTNHPATAQSIVQIGNSPSSQNGSFRIGTETPDGRLQLLAVQDGGSVNPVNYTLADPASLDNLWFPLLMVIRAANDRELYPVLRANLVESATAITVTEALRYITAGETLTGGSDYLGKIAEIAVWESALSDTDIDDYISGVAASSIDTANLVGYWPLSVENTTQADQGPNAGPNLVASGTPVFDADHPTISAGEATFDGTPVVAPTADGYTIDFTITGDDDTVSAVAVLHGEAAPTAAQIHAGNGTGDVAALAADSTAAVADTPDQLVLTGLDFPTHDVYIAVADEVEAFVGELKTAPTGYQYVIIDVPWGMGEESILIDADPAAVDGDIIECSTHTDSFDLGADAHELTMAVDGVPSLDPEGDTSRQLFEARFYDISVGDWSDDPAVEIAINDAAPGFIAAQQEFNFLQNVAIDAVDLTLRWSDPEADDVAVTYQDALPTGLSVTDSVLSGTPTADGASVVTERGTDAYDEFSEVEITFNILETGTMPDVDDGDVTEANAITAITSAGLQSPSVNSASSDTVAAGNVISQTPDPGTIHPVDAATSILISTGAVVVPASSRNTYNNDGFIAVTVLSDTTGLTPWVDYVPVVIGTLGTIPWSTDEGGYIPVLIEE